MQIIKNKIDKKLVVEVEGRIDSITAPLFDPIIANDLEDINELIYDFDRVDYLSSAGLRVLLQTLKIMQNRGVFVLKNVKPVVKEVLDITGFSELITIE